MRTPSNRRKLGILCCSVLITIAAAKVVRAVEPSDTGSIGTFPITWEEVVP